MTRNITRIISVLCVVATAIAPATGAPAGDPSALGDAFFQQMNTLQRTQQQDGSLQFTGANQLFERYPVMATLSLDILRSKPNPAVASRFVASAARYYGYLFTHRDRNSNLLIETSLKRADGATHTGIEDPGFNSLLSLDMINLARLCLEIRRPLQALYWYEGARLLQSEIVDRCFNPESGYFFPFDNNADRLIQDFLALSSLPLAFSGEIGDNHAGAVLHNYALRNPAVSPEPPFVYVGHSRIPSAGDGSILFRPDYLLKSLVVADVLEARGFHKQAAAARQAIAGAVASSGKEHFSGRQPAASSRYLAYLLQTDHECPLVRPLAALELYQAIVTIKRGLPDSQLVRLKRNAETIHSYLLSGGESHDTRTVESGVRDIYVAVSATRRRLKENGLYTREDGFRASGLDLNAATSRLLDDVVTSMRHVENVIYRQRSLETGLQISGTLLHERALVDQRVEVKWVVTCRGSRPVEIRSAKVIRGQEVDSLVGVGGAGAIQPGESRSFVSRFPARTEKPGTLVPWNFTLSLTTADGTVLRYNAFRTLYLEQPLRAVASFPRGHILRGSLLPIELQIVKKTGTPATINCGWHSPSGLQLEEGNRFTLSIPAAQDTARVVVNVRVPSPCRPGSFPFKLKLMNEGRDLGTITSGFFKPYQWLYVGPFEAPDNAVSIPYPPEKAVDLRKAYGGAGGRISWSVLPDDANTSYGEVHLRGAMKPPGVGYLYTVVESPREQVNPLFFAASHPAAVFFNGERVLDYRPGTDRVAATAQVAVQRGMNNILIKIVGDTSSRLYFKLGDDGNMASDEFNNNLWELVGDFGEFQRRSRDLDTADTGEVKRLVTLRYDDPSANSVSVIGTFNGWSPEQSKMRKAPGGGWEITLSLTPGKYAYRFLVNNRRQILDPNCALEEPDGYGGNNSILVVEK